MYIESKMGAYRMSMDMRTPREQNKIESNDLQESTKKKAKIL